jgi:hypothetical protein
MRLIALIMVIAVGGAFCASHPRRHAHAKGKRRVTIEFHRSGGFVAAPGLAIHGKVTLEGGAGTVQVDGLPQRSLTSEEVRTLTQAVNTVGTAKIAPDLRTRGPAPDQYQYDISLVTDKTKLHTVVGERDDVNTLNAAAPGLGSLVAWVRDEADSSYKKKTQSR